MARKIKETPVLTGKDAARFDEAIKANENGKNKVPADAYRRALETFQRVSFK